MGGVLFYNKCRIKTNVLTNIVIKEAEEKDVNFYDYDGFRLLSYTNAEALALTTLPNNPIANENLTFDEWNWSLADIKSQINNVGGVVNVGAIYHTTDDKTHITCKPTETFPQASIRLTPTVASAVTVNWGDGTTDTWTTTSTASKSHTYTGVTETSVYDIAISCTSGVYTFDTNLAGSENDNKKCIYTDIKLSTKALYGPENFSNCFYLQTITIPNNDFDDYLGAYFFQNCYNLKSVNIPNNITSLYNYSFSNCYSLQSASLPSSMGALGSYCFQFCNSLKTITITNNIGILNDYCFKNCYSLQSINVPNSSSWGVQCFYQCSSLQFINIPSNVTSLGDSCFENCYSLTSVNIPSNVTSLGSKCFGTCNSLIKMYFQSATPPTLSNSNAIISNTILVIYVPSGSLSAYQSANNWSTFSSKIKEYNP